MNIMTSLKKKINKLGMWPVKRERNDHEGQNAGVADRNCDRVPYPSIFDDMGPFTAREIFKRRLDKHLLTEMNFERHPNEGRYQIVRMSEAKGNIIHTLLVDKQSKTVISLCRKDARISISKDV